METPPTFSSYLNLFLYDSLFFCLFHLSPTYICTKYFIYLFTYPTKIINKFYIYSPLVNLHKHSFVLPWLHSSSTSFSMIMVIWWILFLFSIEILILLMKFSVYFWFKLWYNLVIVNYRDIKSLHGWKLFMQKSSLLVALIMKMQKRMRRMFVA